MQENSEASVIRPSSFLWYMSILLFSLVLVGIVGLYTSGVYTDNLIKGKESEITQIDHDIQGASLDRKVVIAQIINSNTIRPSLDLKNIVLQFRNAASRAGVGLQGFSIKDDTISTTLVATLGDSQVHPDPAATVIKMMRDYATTKGLYFSLEPITSISGDLTRRTTSIQLKVVPTQPSQNISTGTSK